MIQDLALSLSLFLSLYLELIYVFFCFLSQVSVVPPLGSVCNGVEGDGMYL